MAEKKSWRDYKSKSETDKGTKSGATKSWRDYKSKTESVSENETDGTTNSLNSAGSWKDYNPAPAVGEKIVNRVNTWLNDHNTFISNYQNRYANRKYSYEDSYVSDSADWLNTVKEQKSRFYSEAESILSYMDQNKDYFDKDWMQSVKDKIVGAVEAQSQIVSAATQDNKFWTGFGNEELVSKYGSPEEAYKYYQRADGYSKKYDGLTHEEIQATLSNLKVGEEKDWLSDYQWQRYSDADDFEEYAAKGAAIENPSFNEAQGSAIGPWRWGNEDVGNIVTFSRDNYSDLGAYTEGGRYDAVGSLYYHHMKDDEVKLYNYLLAKEGEEKAAEYLDYLDPYLKARMGGEYADIITGIDIPVLEDLAVMGYGFAAGVDSAVQNTIQLFTSDERPTSATQYANAFISESLDGIGYYAHQAATTVGNMAPSITASTITGSPLVGRVLMGASAAGGAYGDALRSGMSKTEARTYSTLVGASEVMLQSVFDGIGALGGKNGISAQLAPKIAAIDSGLLRGAARLGVSIGSEILEEEAQLYLEPLFKTIITGDEYDAPTITDMVETAIVTMMSTGVLEGGSTVTQSKIEKGLKTEYGGKTDALIQEGLESDVESESYQLATQYQQQVQGKDGKAGKALTGAQIRNLLAANQEQITPKDLKKIQKAAEARLTELGQTEDVEKLAELATKYVTGQKMSKAEKAFLANNKNGNRVAQEALPENILRGDHTSGWAEGIGTKKVNALEYNIKSIVEKITKMDNPAVYKSLEERVGKEDKLSVSKSGQATIRATDETIDLSKVEVADFVRDKDTGKVTDMILNVDGKQVKASEIDYADDNQSYLFSAVKNIENITPGDATVFVRGYDPSSGKTVGEYLNGIDEAYTYGYHKYSETDMGAGLFTPKLSSEQAKGAYLLGQTTRNKADANKSVAIKRMRTAVEAEAMKSAAEGRAAPKSKQMTITYNAGNGNIVDFNESGIELTDRNEAAVKVAQFLHRLGLGTNFEFFASELSDTMKVKDKKTGEEVAARVFVDEFGNEQLAPAGVYRLSDGTIRVDLNAYNGRQFALNALAHELTHFIQQWSDEKYKVLAEFLVNTYEKTGMTMHQRVLREQARLKEIRGEDVSYNKAYDEVVANAMGKMFDDGRLLARLTELKAKDKDLVQKLWEGIKEIVGKMLGVYKADPGLFDDAKDIWKLKEDFEKLQDIFAEALVEASDNFQEAQTIGFEMDMGTESVSPAVMHSSRETDLDTNTDSAYDGGKKKIEQEDKTNVRREEVSHRVDAESSRGVGKENSGGEGSARESCERRIKEILREKTVKRHKDSTSGRGRVETKETREDFENRVRNDGLMYVEAGSVAMAFQVAPEASWNKNAKAAADKLAQYGFDVVVFTGEMLHNRKGVTQPSVDGLTARHAGNLTIFISAELDIDGMETAYHEAFHGTRHGLFAKYHEKIADIIASNVDVESDSFTEFISIIADLYAYTESNVSASKFASEIIEEFYAWYVGKAYATVSGEMQVDMAQFSDVESIKQQIGGVYAQMEANADKAFPGLVEGQQYSSQETDADYSKLSYAEISEEQQKLYKHERDLIERKRAAENDPELLQAMDDYHNMFSEMKDLLAKRRAGTATQAELDRIEEIKALRENRLKRVADLQESLGLNALTKEAEEIRAKKEVLRVASDKAWVREGAEKENKAIEKSGLSAPEYFRNKALKAFKTTTNFNEAGYLLPDGKLLNFSGGERNHRYRDHREIGEIYEATNGAAALNRFMSDGNIRIMAESPGIDLASGIEPTKEQYAALRKFINTNGVKDGQFFVDFSDKEGHRAGNYSYNGRVNADRIINDIKYFYQTGSVRESSGLTNFIYSPQETDADNAPTFYSQMGKVVEGMKQEKFGASSVISMLRGRGVKAEEIRWSGIHAFLDGKKSVTKAELIDFINSSMLHIEEESRGGDALNEFVDEWRRIMDYNASAEDFNVDENFLSEAEEYLQSSVDEGDIEQDEMDHLMELAKKASEGNKPSKWDDYKLDGGKNYRELVFKMPGSDFTNNAMKAHWGDDAQGVLAHARIQDFDVNDKKLLFIEEIQSDWHNDGNKAGYDVELTKEEKAAALAKVRADFMSSEVGKSIIKKVKQQRESDPLQQPFKDDNEVYEWIEFQPAMIGSELAVEYPHWSTPERLQAIIELDENVSKLNRRLVPDAPFKSSYHEYVLKRLLRMAAEEGYDSIGWATADIQSKRWSEDYAEGYRIEYDQDIPKFLKKYGKQWGAEVGKTTLGNESNTESYTDGDGKSYQSVREWYDSVMDSYSTKDMGVWNAYIAGKTKVIQVGDKMHIQMKDTGNILDESLTVHTEPDTVWSMDITDAMKKSVLKEGQAMYSSQETDMDTDGNQLTKEQSAFFAQSKLRDELGRLISMYHGTNNPYFTVFDPQYSDDLISLFFTSDPDVANTYTNAQDYGRDVDPYNLITKDSSAEQFNAAQEKLGGGLRVVKITPEWIAEMKRTASDKCSKLIIEAETYAALLEKSGNQKLQNHTDRIRRTTSKGAENLTASDISSIRSALFDASQAMSIYNRDATVGKNAREQYKAVYDLLNVEHYVRAARTPESAIGKYTYTETNSMLPFAVETTGRGFTGDTFAGTESEAVARAIDRTKWVKEHSLGNRYKVYLNLTNPYIIDAGTDISGKMDHVYLSRRYSGDGWKIELESKDNDLTKYMTTDEFEAFVENAFDAKTTAKIKAQIEADNQAYQEEWGDLDPDYVDHNIELKDVNLTYIEPGNWNSLNFNGMENARTRDVTAWAKDKGYDGVIFKNMKDAGGYAFTKGRGGSIVAVAFKPEQVKSVDNKKPTADKDIRYSTQETDNISNRDMLANAFETLSQNSDEYKMIQEYKGRVKILNEYEAKLAKLNAEIHKMMFDPDTERDAKKLKELQAKAKKVASDINRHDKKLLSMEASEPLRKVIEQERKKATQETRDHVKEIQKNKKARAEQTELRHKIRKAVRDLDKLLNRGNKKTNVKEDMKSFVSKALELADYIFTDHITNDELIRNGITVRMTAYEKKLVRETEDILNKLYDEADSLTDEEFARLDAKRKSNEDKLRDLLKAQRNERLSTPVYQLFNDLVTEYASLKNSSQDSVKAAYNEELENSLRAFISDDDRVKILKNMRVADMTAEELNWLYRAYTMVLTNVRNANKFHVKGMNESIEQVVGQIAGDFGSRKIPDKKLAIAVQKFVNKLGWDYEKLYYALDRIGSDAFTKLIMNIADSENTVMQDIMEAAAFRDKIVENYGFNNWDINKEIDREFLDNTGKKFKLTLGQLMSLYAYSRRDGAWDHIEYGGFVFGEAALTNPRPADSYKLSKEQCEAITSLLTKEQKGYVEDMQKFLSETMGAKGNEVSMLLYGIKMFGEKNYFPIHIAGQFKAQANESQAKAAAGFSSMSNAGFTHAQNPNAKAPFVLEGFNEIWVDHVNEMSRYHGTVPALEDLRRVMNRSTYSDAVSESQSIKQLMENSYGKEAVDYFDNLYREANSGAITDKLQKPSQKLLSLFRKNSVAYSLSVIIQQPAAMVRAYDLIDKKYFGFKGFGALTSGVAKAVSSKWNPAYANAYNEMLKYAPGVTMAKEIGGFDTHTGGSIRSYLLDTKKSLKQKWKTGTAMEKGKAVLDLVDDNAVANLPNVADKIAWIEIWNACKRETLATHKNLAVNSEEFMQAVGDRFTEVIRATQVYDSMFAKSPMLKSKNIAVQYLVSFMNEPNTVANMAEKAVRDVTRGDWKKGLRTGVVVINSIIFTNMLKSIIYAMRDDDEDETYIEKYIEAITGNMMDDFWVPNYIPIARDVWSLAQGYDVERADMAIVSDALGAFNNVLKNAFTQTEDMTEEQLIELDKKQTEAGWQLVESLAAFLGIPVKNIRRDIEGILDHARIASANAGQTTAQSSWDKIYDAVVDWIPFMQNKNTKQDKLYEVIMSGDKEYLARLKNTYKDDSAYQSAVRKALRENDPRIHDAAQARYEGNTEEYKRIFREIQGEGKFTFNEIMGAVNAEENAIKNKLEPEKATSEYSASDYVEAVAMGYTSNAEAMKEDIIATKVANGKTQEEAEKEFISNVSTGIRDAYASGLLDEAGAKKMLMEYAGKDEEEAASRVSYWSFCEEHPEYDRLSESNVNDYREFAEPANIPLDVFDQYVQGTKGLAEIKDKWGDVEVTKREQVLEVIDSLPLTRQQKDALYLAAGYSESKIWDVPW